MFDYLTVWYEGLKLCYIYKSEYFEWGYFNVFRVYSTQKYILLLLYHKEWELDTGSTF